jgi:hypothetical protein
MMNNAHPAYAVHEITLPSGKVALRAYVNFDKALVTAMRNIGKRTARLSFGKSSDGRAYWSISASSKEVDAFREAMARAAARAADQTALSTP